MSEKIKGILIDPHEKTVQEIELEKPLLGSLYKAINCQRVDCVSMESVGSVPHDIVVDDEGMFFPNQRFFRIIPHTPYSILAGFGVIVSVGKKGEWESHQLDFEDIKKKVQFLTGWEARAIAEELGI